MRNDSPIALVCQGGGFSLGPPNGADPLPAKAAEGGDRLLTGTHLSGNRANNGGVMLIEARMQRRA